MVIEVNCHAAVQEWLSVSLMVFFLNTHCLASAFIFLRPYLTPTKRWWRCLLWCTTYEPCQPGTRLSYARGRSLFLSAATQSIRTTRSPSATDAPCATSFIWGEPADDHPFFSLELLFSALIHPPHPIDPHQVPEFQVWEDLPPSGHPLAVFQEVHGGGQWCCLWASVFHRVPRRSSILATLLRRPPPLPPGPQRHMNASDRLSLSHGPWRRL